MNKLIEIAKANGADYELDYADDSSPASKQEYITFTDDQLRATVEQVCAPLVEALNFYANQRNWSKDSQEYGSEVSDYNVMWKDFHEINQATRSAGFKAITVLKSHRALIGDKHE